MKRYQSKRSKAIGTVVSDGITPVLRFEDGSELILTPANLRNDWILLEDESPKHITYSEFCSEMYKWNASHNEDKAEKFGVIVYKQSNFKNEYSEESRSYRVHNANRTFQKDKIANSLFGDCLDGTDNGVRLDWYKWTVEFCYFE